MNCQNWFHKFIIVFHLQVGFLSNKGNPSWRLIVNRKGHLWTNTVNSTAWKCRRDLGFTALSIDLHLTSNGRENQNFFICIIFAPSVWNWMVHVLFFFEKKGGLPSSVNHWSDLNDGRKNMYGENALILGYRVRHMFSVLVCFSSLKDFKSDPKHILHPVISKIDTSKDIAVEFKEILFMWNYMDRTQTKIKCEINILCQVKSLARSSALKLMICP